MTGASGAPATASSMALTINLVMMGLGTGLLTMPWGVAGSSIMVSLVLLALILALNYWTIMILIRACEAFQEFDLGGLLSHLPGKLGPRLQQVVNYSISVSQFLVLVGYTIVVRDSLFILQGDTFLSKEALSLAVGLVVLPLSFLDQSYLAFTSTLGILANVYLILLLIAYGAYPDAAAAAAPRAPAEESGLCLFGLGSGVVTQFSLIMYTIVIQMCVPPMYQELEHRSPQKFRRCLFVAFVLLYVLFGAVMISGYMAFGPRVNASVLDDLPNDAWGVVARIGMIFCILGCYPLNVKPIVAPFLRAESSVTEPLLAEAEGHKAPPVSERSGRLLLLTLVVVVPVTLVSLCISSLGPLNAVNGALMVAAFIGLAPSLVGLYLSDVGPLQRACLYTLLVLSVLASLLGLVATDNNQEALMEACMFGMAWH